MRRKYLPVIVSKKHLNQEILNLIILWRCKIGVQSKNDRLCDIRNSYKKKKQKQLYLQKLTGFCSDGYGIISISN